MDVFTIRAVDLEEPIRIVVGHDGRGDSPGWFLDRVLIRCGQSQSEAERSSSELQRVNYVFLCERLDFFYFFDFYCCFLLEKSIN